MLKAIKRALLKLRIWRLKVQYENRKAISAAVEKKYGTASRHFSKWYVKSLDTFWLLTDAQALLDAGTAEEYLNEAAQRKAALNVLIETIERENK